MTTMMTMERIGRYARVACASWLLAAGAVHAQDPAKLPPEDYLRSPAYSQVRLSPDGRLLAALVPVNGRQNLALVDLVKRTATAMTSFKEEDVVGYAWVGERSIQLRTGDLQDASGFSTANRNLLIDVEKATLLRDMRLSAQRNPSQIIAVLDGSGEDLIVQNNDRSLYGVDAYRYNPRTNSKQLLTLESPGDVERFVADRKGQVRIAVSNPRGAERTRLYYRRGNEDKWILLRDDPLEDRVISPIAFDFDDKTLYVRVRNAEKGGRADLYAFDPETNQLGARVVESTGLDTGELVFDWVRKVPVGVGDGSRDAVNWIDPEWKALQRSIDAVLPDTRNQMSWGRYDTSRIIVSSESELQPPLFFLLDRKTMKLEEVAAAYPKLKPEMLSARRFVQYKARDGLTIPGYLTLPRHPDGTKPPLIVDIHGGPFVGATPFGYSGTAQFFASRGYAVLQPDFRGTIGYGDAFHKAGWRQWGLAMQDDVTDGVKWLIATGKVDADRVCLFGASYGGYATLWGLEKEPQMFRCGVAFFAVSDLELLFDVTWSDTNQGARGDEMTKIMSRRVGDPDKDRDAMRAVSPLYHADRLQAPLLLAYGSVDRRVPLIHGNRMRDALDKAGKTYEWNVYTGDPHGFAVEEHKFDFYRKVEAFLARNLQPRAGATGQ